MKTRKSAKDTVKPALQPGNAVPSPAALGRRPVTSFSRATTCNKVIDAEIRGREMELLNIFRKHLIFEDPQPDAGTARSLALEMMKHDSESAGRAFPAYEAYGREIEADVDERERPFERMDTALFDALAKACQQGGTP